MYKILLAVMCLVVTSPLVLAEIPDYKRSYFSGWLDEDRDCQNTRQEVLIKESVIPVTMDDEGCRVVAGFWVDPYTGRTTNDPRDLDIDHMVPLEEAWASGAHKWSKKKRVIYANDLSDPKHLVAVLAMSNRSKGAKDPANWMPSNVSYWEEYLNNWVDVKTRYGLSIDDDEARAIAQARIIYEEAHKGFKFRDSRHLQTVADAIK